MHNFLSLKGYFSSYLKIYFYFDLANEKVERAKQSKFSNHTVMCTKLTLEIVVVCLKR